MAEARRLIIFRARETLKSMTSTGKRDANKYLCRPVDALSD